MIVIKDRFENIVNNEKITLTIGNFDGVHLGHQFLIKNVLKYEDSKHALMTFYPHPMKVLRDVSFKEVSNLNQKIAFLKEFNLDYVFIVEFIQSFYELSKYEFINFLKRLNVIRLVIGKDFRFGINAEGSLNDLYDHFEVIVIDDKKEGHIRISTTYIKDLILESNLEKAKEMLTRDYQIDGIVIDGDKVGKTLGFPTANLLIENYVLPNNGVYYVEVLLDNKRYGGALNIGYNPTINYSTTKRVEVYILNFNKQIYGEKITVVLKKFIRPELKFKSREELIERMTSDVNLCKNLFNEVK